MHTTDGTTLAELREIDPDEARLTKNRDTESVLPDGSLYHRYIVDDTHRGKHGKASVSYHQG